MVDFKKEKQNVKFANRPKKRPLALYIVCGLVLTTGLAYLVSVNKVATDGYQVKELTERIEELKYENKKLELESSDLRSMANVSRVGQNLELVAVKDMDYLSAPSGAVALSR